MSEAMQLAEFAAMHNLPMYHARILANEGHILGARFDSHRKRWLVFPPAKLLRSVRKYAARRADNEAGQVERRPRTEAEFNGAGPFLLSGRPTYYTDPVVQRACRSIIAAAAELKKGAKP